MIQEEELSQPENSLDFHKSCDLMSSPVRWPSGSGQAFQDGGGIFEYLPLGVLNGTCKAQQTMYLCGKNEEINKSQVNFPGACCAVVNYELCFSGCCWRLELVK